MNITYLTIHIQYKVLAMIGCGLLKVPEDCFGLTTSTLNQLIHQQIRKGKPWQEPSSCQDVHLWGVYIVRSKCFSSSA
jgi:hypothetical protein